MLEKCSSFVDTPSIRPNSAKTAEEFDENKSKDIKEAYIFLMSIQTQTNVTNYFYRSKFLDRQLVLFGRTLGFVLSGTERICPLVLSELFSLLLLCLGRLKKSMMLSKTNGTKCKKQKGQHGNVYKNKARCLLSPTAS